MKTVIRELQVQGRGLHFKLAYPIDSIRKEEDRCCGNEFQFAFLAHKTCLFGGADHIYCEIMVHNGSPLLGALCYRVPYQHGLHEDTDARGRPRSGLESG